MTDLLTRPRLELDYDEAQRFLSLLDPDTDTFTFQAFRQTGGYAWIKTGRLVDLWGDIQRSNEQGAGIAVTVNPTRLGETRSGEAVTSVRAVWHDDDTGYTGAFPLLPSITVETSPGRFHRYWKVADLWPVDAEGRDDFRRVMTGMETLGGDRQATDIARCLRLPGTYNHKHGRPFLARIVEPDDDGQSEWHSRAELVAAFAVEPSPARNKSVDALRAFASEAGEHDIARIKDALAFIPPESRTIWFEVCKALHHEFGGGTVGFRIWDDWSRTTQAGNYDEADQHRTWESLRQDHPDPTTLGSLFRAAELLGWGKPDGELAENTIPAAKGYESGTLSRNAIASLERFYGKEGQSRSKSQWLALADVAETLEAIANETAEPLYYLCSLDPGVGKTQTIVRFTRELLSSSAHTGVAVLILVGRLREIPALVQDMELSEADYAVLVADDPENADLNAMGNPSRDQARVLFTTQQMFVSRAKKHGSFSEISEFWYHGQPRRVRLWDERCSPARPLTIDLSQIEGLTDEAKHKNPDFFALLRDLMARIHQAGSKGCVSVPDWESKGLTQSAVSAIYDKHPGRRQVVAELFFLSGQIVTVKTFGGDKTVISYEDTLPADSAPMVIFDASGRVSGTYPHWSDGRGGLLQLRSADLNYENLTLLLWERAGGKHAWEQVAEAEEMVAAIVDLVNSKPGEPFLIFHHMKNDRFEVDVPEAIRDRAVNPDRLVFVHHDGEDSRATNKYKDIENIILAGTLFLPKAQYESLGRLSRGLTADQQLDARHRRDIELGEHAHRILQSVCRGSVRKSNDGTCAKSSVYVIASTESGIPAMLKAGRIFPGAKVREWIAKADRTGQVSDAKDILRQHFMLHDEPISVAEVAKRAGVTDRNNFNKRVLPVLKDDADLLTLPVRLQIRKGRGGSVFVKGDGVYPF